MDGLQRITAFLRFLNNEIKVFGNKFEDFSGKISNTLSFNMLNIKNKKELLNIYIDFNSGGSIHKPEEIKRIQKMIENTPEDEVI